MSFSSGSRPAPLPALQLRHCGPAHILTAPTSSGNIASRTVFLIYYYVGVIDGHDVLFRGLHRPHVKSLPSAPAAAKVSCRQRVPPAPRAAPLRVVPSAFPVRCPMLWRQTVHNGSMTKNEPTSWGGQARRSPQISLWYQLLTISRPRSHQRTIYVSP